MAAISSSMAVGAYYATLGASPLGLTEGPMNFQFTPHGIPIRCDFYGETIIDYIMTGADVFFTLVIKQWSSTVRSVLWPYNSGKIGILSDDVTTTPPAGRLLSAIAGALTLTPYTGTPAATIGTNTWTTTYAVALPGSQISIPAGNVERNIPVTFAVLPNLASTAVQHVVTS